MKTCDDCDKCITGCKNKQDKICSKFVDKYEVANKVAQELGWDYFGQDVEDYIQEHNKN